MKNPVSSGSSSDKEGDDREDGPNSEQEAHPPWDGEQECQDQKEELELDELGLEGLFEECPNLDEEESQGLESEQTFLQHHIHFMIVLECDPFILKIQDKSYSCGKSDVTL